MYFYDDGEETDIDWNKISFYLLIGIVGVFILCLLTMVVKILTN